MLRKLVAEVTRRRAFWATYSRDFLFENLDAFKGSLEEWDESLYGLATSLADLSDCRIPVEMLDAAVRYTKTADKKHLLKLPLEQRQLLEDILPQQHTRANRTSPREKHGTGKLKPLASANSLSMVKPNAANVSGYFCAKRRTRRPATLTRAQTATADLSRHGMAVHPAVFRRRISIWTVAGTGVEAQRGVGAG